MSKPKIYMPLGSLNYKETEIVFTPEDFENLKRLFSAIGDFGLKAFQLDEQLLEIKRMFPDPSELRQREQNLFYKSGGRNLIETRSGNRFPAGTIEIGQLIGNCLVVNPVIKTPELEACRFSVYPYQYNIFTKKANFVNESKPGFLELYGTAISDEPTTRADAINYYRSY